MAKKTQTVKNQHTVQKALLKLFSDDGLHRFEISTREWKRRSAEKATVGIYFYDMINPDGTRNQEIEHWLGKLENKVSPLIKRINEQGTELNQPERGKLRWGQTWFSVFNRITNRRADDSTEARPL